MKLQPYEQVLIDGGRDDLLAFGSCTHCVVVDWRDDVETILVDVKRMLPQGYLNYRQIDERTWELQCRGESRTIMAGEVVKKEVLLQSINQVLLPEYEMRIFTPTMGDGYSLLVRRSSWWRDFSAAHPSGARKLFVTTDERVAVTGSANAPRPILSSGQIRKRGLKFLAIGGGLFGLVVALLFWLSAHAHSIHLPLLGASLPLALALIGGVELITGAPFQRLAGSWMRLRGWQRGVLGTLIVLTSLAIIMCLVTFFVLMFT